jgi:hypothetical protein
VKVSAGLATSGQPWSRIRECQPGRRLVVIVLPTEASVDPADDALLSAKYGERTTPWVVENIHQRCRFRLNSEQGEFTTRQR